VEREIEASEDPDQHLAQVSFGVVTTLVCVLA
jgi:hypothetical protein